MKTKIFLLAGVLILSSLACSFFSQMLEGEDVHVEPATIEEPIQPEPVQPTAVPTVSNIVFEDDFSDTSSGWDMNEDEDGITDYDNGSYHIRIDTPELFVWANPSMEGRIPSDVRIEVEATNIGVDNNSMGIICRYSWTNDEPSFYRFLISSDGYGAIVRVLEGGQEVISSENKLLQYNAIKQGQTTNHIMVECIGNQLSLYANGTLLDRVTDTTLKDGDVGLFASTYDEPGTDLLFDNFIVTRP